MDNDFKTRIVNDFGLDKMDSAEQERMIEKIGNLLFESVVERTIDLMDEEMMNKFDEAIENSGENYQQIIAFLKENIPGFDKIVSEELTRLKRATTGIFA